MTLSDRFVRFFQAANGGRSPYPWQHRLMERVAVSGRWPEVIAAPTGAGKSSVIDIHVFLVAERGRQVASGQIDPSIARPPRRLVLVAPRRVLVDDQFERASALSRLLTESGDQTVRELAGALANLISAIDERVNESPLWVARLRGGVALDLSWRLDPSACQVICATPQMWGSRLLLRGYRSSRLARNLESGLLAHDTTVIIDEAHLHRRLVRTARTVGEMDGSAMGVQVVAMSATVEGRTLEDEDFADPSLKQRVEAPKQIDHVEVDGWTDALVRAAIVGRARELSGDGTVGVFVNTVKRALDVAGELGSGPDTNVVLVCGRMRPADLARVRSESPGLLDARGNPEVDFLVSTQSLEVGVDMDLPAMVTEIASASALAQRAGRLNRSGSRASAPFSVVHPAGASDLDPEAAPRSLSFAPYSIDDILAAWRWLDALAGDASPRRISDSVLPVSAVAPTPELTRVDLTTLAMTSLPLAAEPDVALYIEEPVDAGPATVSICARDNLAHGYASRDALGAAPPRAHELASFPIGRELPKLLAAVESPRYRIRTRGGESEVDEIDDQSELTDGDVIVIRSGSRVSTQGVIGEPRQGSTAIGDVADEPGEDREPVWIVPLEHEEIEKALLLDGSLGTHAARNLLADLLRAQSFNVATRRLRGRLRDVEVTWCPGRDDAIGLVVIRSTNRGGRVLAAALEEVVTLGDHQSDVRDRIVKIIDALDPVDLGADRRQLECAALQHDAGKRHPRFQRRMGATAGSVEVAKPVPGHKADRGHGWRHEQLSVAVEASAGGRDPLVTGIIATHHGHGRPLFARGPESVLDGWSDCPSEDVAALGREFGAGGVYERQRAQLEEELGVHRLAFLEALLRCADMQVSREGR